MKTNLLLFSLLLSVSLLSAQNVFFKKFGTSNEQVHSFLQTRNNMEILVKTDDLIIASNGALVMTYHFYQDQLFKTVLQKSYESKKEVMEGQKGLENYYDLLQAEMIEMENSRSKTHFVAVKNREVHEVYRVSGEDDYRIQMVTTNLDLNPEKMDQYETIDKTQLLSMVNW